MRTSGNLENLALFLKQSAFGRFKDEDNLEEMFIAVVSKINVQAARKGGKNHKWQVKLRAKNNPIEG